MSSSLYDVGEWQIVDVQNPPPPCGGAAFVRFDPHRAIAFGGRVEGDLSNAFFILNLSTKVLCKKLTIISAKLVYVCSAVHSQINLLLPELMFKSNGYAYPNNLIVYFLKGVVRSN